MPDEEKKMVPIDTSGPDATIDIEEVKDESVVETEAPKQETQEPAKEETQEKKQDENLEDYSKGVQARIAKLTRKMGSTEMGGHRSTEEGRQVSTMRKTEGEQKEVSKMRSTCKSHTDDKVAKGECCQTKKSCR